MRVGPVKSQVFVKVPGKTEAEGVRMMRGGKDRTHHCGL